MKKLIFASLSLLIIGANAEMETSGGHSQDVTHQIAIDKALDDAKVCEENLAIKYKYETEYEAWLAALKAFNDAWKTNVPKGASKDLLRKTKAANASLFEKQKELLKKIKELRKTGKNKNEITKLRKQIKENRKKIFNTDERILEEFIKKYNLENLHKALKDAAKAYNEKAQLYKKHDNCYKELDTLTAALRR